MADYQYAIGTAADNLQNLEDDLGIPPPHPAPHTEWATEYEAGDGRQYGDGWPSVTWRWAYLNATHLAALRTYCTGKSAHVYIKTLKPDLTTYGTYYCVMVWPDDPKYRPGRVKLDFEIQFTHLEEVT
jgi:hypothetical protein